VFGGCRGGGAALCVLGHEAKLVVVVVGSGYVGRRWAASISDWRPRRRAVVTALDVEVGSVPLLVRVG
jgi:hypothetical protein